MTKREKVKGHYRTVTRDVETGRILHSEKWSPKKKVTLEPSQVNPNEIRADPQMAQLIGEPSVTVTPEPSPKGDIRGPALSHKTEAKESFAGVPKSPGNEAPAETDSASEASAVSIDDVLMQMYETIETVKGQTAENRATLNQLVTAPVGGGTIFDGLERFMAKHPAFEEPILEAIREIPKMGMDVVRGLTGAPDPRDDFAGVIAGKIRERESEAMLARAGAIVDAIFSDEKIHIGDKDDSES